MTDKQEEEKLASGNSTHEPVPQQEASTPAGPEGAPSGEPAELGTIRTLATVGAIGAPVSLIIGGTALSTVSIVCAIIALVKLRKIKAYPQSTLGILIKPVRLLALMGLVVGCFAFTFNVINMIIMVPLIMEAMTTGDYSSVFGADSEGLFGGPSSNDTNPWG